MAVEVPLEVSESVDPDALRTVPRRHPGRWVSGAIVVFGLGLLVNSLARNERMEWGIIHEYFFSDVVLTGLLNTLKLTVVIMVVGCVLGVVLAVMHHSHNVVLSSVAKLYIWVFRSVPPLVQLLVWYNLAALYPKLSFGIPFGPELFSGSANAYITPFVAAILGLGLNEAAYMAEIIRAGISAVDKGQVEAAQSLGFAPARIMRRVVLPQALKVIVPPTGNETITVLKATSLVSIISMTDLLYSVQLVYSKTFQNIPLLAVACIWYLLVTSVLTALQMLLERRLGQGSATGGGGRRFFSRYRSNLTRYRTDLEPPLLESRKAEA